MHRQEGAQEGLIPSYAAHAKRVYSGGPRLTSKPFFHLRTGGRAFLRQGQHLPSLNAQWAHPQVKFLNSMAKINPPKKYKLSSLQASCHCRHPGPDTAWFRQPLSPDLAHAALGWQHARPPGAASSQGAGRPRQTLLEAHPASASHLLPARLTTEPRFSHWQQSHP